MVGPTVDVVRGAIVESRHRVSVAVCDAEGALAAHAGDPDLVTFWRSAAKFFQAIPLAASGGRVVPKVGAEGVYCAALPEQGLGVAVKVEDGDFRSATVALLAVLDQLVPGLAVVGPEWRSPPVKNTRGMVVGRMEARLPLAAGGR